MSSVRDEIFALQSRMDKYILGQSEIVERILMGILSNGNVLVEGLPGLAKTTAIKALSDNLECTFGRIQFTPDLVTSDIVGKTTAYKVGEETQFKFDPGPIFNNIVLADEINRAPSKTQNALLEAMEERQVTVNAKAHKVPDLFMVMATQNPGVQVGTFPLPEAQLDRFIMKIEIVYHNEETEIEVVRMLRDKSSQKARKQEKSKDKPKPILTAQETIFEARGEIDEITVPDHIERYLVDIIYATRFPERYTYELKSYIEVGASPRASLSIDRMARTLCWVRGQKEVTAEMIQEILRPTLRHRIAMTERAAKHKVHPDELITDIIELVPVPEPQDGHAPQTADEVEAGAIPEAPEERPPLTKKEQAALQEKIDDAKAKGEQAQAELDKAAEKAAEKAQRENQPENQTANQAAE